MKSKLLGRLLRTNRSQQSINRLRGENDLPSVEEFITPHLSKMEDGRGMKGMFTSDGATTDAAMDVFRSHKNGKNLDFFKDNILSQPPHSTKEDKSLKVKISDIGDFAKYFRDYEAEKDKNSMICIGGPAAEDQMVMSRIISSVRERLEDTTYITRDYKESNVNHSAKQSHARHANALNADHNLTGHSLIPTLITRKILGTTLDEVMESDYRKIDVDFTLDPKKLSIYFNNELNWLKQEQKKRSGELTDHDINRIEAILSQEIMRVVQDEAGIDISGHSEKSVEDSSSIHVTFTEKDRREVEHENETFKRVDINPQRLTREEINFLFESDEIQSAWKYPGDTHVKFDDHETNKKYSQSQGAKWIEGQEVDRILLTKNEEGNAKIAGVMTQDGQYYYANKLHFTGGYKVEYEYDKESPARFLSNSKLRNLVNKVEDIFGLQQPLSSDTTTATGVSINALFAKSDRMKRIIEKYGSIGEIAITNSHWTMIAENDSHLMVRITGGGNTGSEEYNPTYFLNTIANTRRIFGDDLVGIVSTYGCPRSVNARNSTEFDKIAEGGIISYGKGGTGNTKRHAEAAMGLIMLGFEEEVIDYFNKFQGRHNQPMGDELKEVYQHIKDVEFLHDNVKRTNRRMGYDEALSFEEATIVGIIMAAVSFALYKNLKKDQEDSPTQSDGIKVTSSSNLATHLSDKENERS